MHPPPPAGSTGKNANNISKQNTPHRLNSQLQLPKNNPPTTSAVPAVPDASASAAAAVNPFAPTDHMKEWFKLQFQGLAKESQVKELSNRVSVFERTVKNVADLTEKIVILETNVVTKDQLEHEITEFTVRIDEHLKQTCDNITTDMNNHQFDIIENSEAIAEFSKQICDLKDSGTQGQVSTSHSKTAILGMANEYVCGNKLYWRSINFGKRSGVIMLVIKDTDLYNVIAPLDGADEDAKSTFELNFRRLRKVLGVKIAQIQDYNTRKSLSGNVVTKCRVVGNSPADTYDKIKKLIDTKHEKSKSKYVNISLITPEEFDISNVLDFWVDELKCAIKCDITKSGGVTVMINDGKTCEASGSIPAVTADKKDHMYLKSCSRLNITSPHALAKLELPTISNLRRLASGKWFVYNGKMFEYPENFKKAPRNPGFVNETYDKDYTGEFELTDEENDGADSDTWSVANDENGALKIIMN